MADHLFRCINRKCKQRNKQQVRAEFKSNTRCSSCKQVMRYDGEQGKLFDGPQPNTCEHCGQLLSQHSATTHTACLEKRIDKLEKQVAELLAANLYIAEHTVASLPRLGGKS